MKWFKRKVQVQTKPSIEEQQKELLAKIGTQLQSWRQEQAVSLDELVLLTRIPRRLLQAIEEGNLADLPEPIYIQGLIRQFADALGMKGAELASSFPLGAPTVSGENKLKVKNIAQLRPLHLYLLYIFLIFCSVNGLSQLLNRSALQANNSQSELNSQQLSNNNNESFADRDLSDVTSKTAEKAVQIGVTLKASSWIRVIADGQTQFEGVLPEGTHRTWKAQEQLTVKTDNAGGVLMSVNQQKAREMGKPGQVEEVKIAAKPQS
ncbi:helix-turn-helix domain-containing protein [Richelia sinica]|uniref:helix-turn-helix domain-containing protein n=1 Tax=Richelia sinica TaxID=1357545 RepID=UPI001683B02C|nr:RodZ domain-containing protein [Richelia sinica]MBD2664938.1 helix-turn-helix domain-containing protein [Richelia sinica FACHB-800]